MMTVLDGTSALPHHGPHIDGLSSRRFRVLGAASLLICVFFCQNLFYISVSKDSKDASTSLSRENLMVEVPTNLLSPVDSIEEADTAAHVQPEKKDAASVLTCQVPGTDPDPNPNNTPKLTSSATASIFSNCSSTMGKHLTAGREKLVPNLPKNPRAHIFSFPTNVRNEKGQRPLLCVPQKNGNKQFGGFVYAAWNKKPAISGEGVDRDMGHWEHHKLSNGKKSKESHVYFVARNPYSRVLSLYLQKVVSACISDDPTGSYRCARNGWRGIRADTSFKDFVTIIDERLTRKKSLCEMNAHLCQQVESCLTTTLSAKEVTIIRLEEQSCWFPCLVKQIGIKSALLSNGWDAFSGSSCYYTATDDCKDMLRSIDPTRVGHLHGTIHATGASSRLAEHYDAETATIVSRWYADDFRILGYPLWDGVIQSEESQ